MPITFKMFMKQKKNIFFGYQDAFIGKGLKYF